MSPIAERGDVLAVVGMTREAKILTGAAVVIGGGDLWSVSASAARWIRR
jgi:hypothetical protein